MAAQKDAAERQAKSDRFMSGIRRFSVFLVEAAKNGPRDVRFEKDVPKKRTYARRPAARKPVGKAAPDATKN